MNVSETERAAFELTDAMGPDFSQLAPRGEGHLDPVSVAVYISYAIMSAAGAGVAAGVKEWSKDKTVQLLDGVSAQIRRRLAHSVRAAFSTVQTPEVEHAARDDATKALRSAQGATAPLDDAVVTALASLSAASVRTALQELGLNARAGERVEATVEHTLKITLRDNGKSEEPSTA